jgi:hypothetical protein
MRFGEDARGEISKGSMMPAGRLFKGLALLSFYLAFGVARADLIGSGAGIAAGSFKEGGTTQSGNHLGFFESRDARAERLGESDPGDLIFDADFDGQHNGGITCATATVLDGETTYAADTNPAPNWMVSFGPQPSLSHDVVYTFVAGPVVEGSITPTIADYSFAMYLIPDCNDLGTEPAPIGATATIGRGIDLAAAGVISGETYYLAITGVAAGGPSANGTLNFTTPFSLRPGPKR